MDTEKPKSSVEGKAEGHRLEVDLFGVPNINMVSPSSELDKKRRGIIRKRNEELERLRTEEGYSEDQLENTPALNFRESLEIALIINPVERQTSPEKEIARDIRNKIVREEFMEDPKKVRFFCSVATPLDYHGVDSFFVINGIPITLDASHRNKESHELKADILVPDFPLKEDDPETYEYWIRERMEKIMSKYREKLGKLKKGDLDKRDFLNIITITDTLTKVISTEELTNIRKIANLQKPKEVKTEIRAETTRRANEARLQRAKERALRGRGRKTEFK